MPLLAASVCAGHQTRIVTLAGGDSEGLLATDDLPAWHVPFSRMNGHISTLTTLALEGLASEASEAIAGVKAGANDEANAGSNAGADVWVSAGVDAMHGISFITTYPGYVATPYHALFTGALGWMVWFIDTFLAWALNVPLEESAQRHLWLLTTPRFKGKAGSATTDSGVEGEDEVAAIGTNGTRGSGVYSVTWKGKGGSKGPLAWLRRYRSEGMVEVVKAHNEEEFERVRRM